MPRRVQQPYQVKDAALAATLDHLRKGTFEIYESDWTYILTGDSFDFQHELGEVPCTVDVLKSEDATGSVKYAPGTGGAQTNPLPIAGTVTVTKETRIVKVANATGSNLYFKVRAF